MHVIIEESSMFLWHNCGEGGVGCGPHAELWLKRSTKSDPIVAATEDKVMGAWGAMDYEHMPTWLIYMYVACSPMKQRQTHLYFPTKNRRKYYISIWQVYRYMYIVFRMCDILENEIKIIISRVIHWHGWCHAQVIWCTTLRNNLCSSP